MEKNNTKNLENILEKILLEWRFIGLSKEKLKEKIALEYKEVENDETRTSEYL